MSVTSNLPRPAARILVPVILLGILLGGVIALLILVSSMTVQRERELVTWQVRMSAVAESQAESMRSQVNRLFTPLRALAENNSVQLYMTELAQGGGPDRAVADAAQRHYLRTLLVFSAQRDGFVEYPQAPPIESNIRRLGHAGLALLDAERRLIATSPDMPPMEGALADRLTALPAAHRGLLDLFPLADGVVVVGAVEPIFAIQADQTPDQLVGYAVGVIPANSEFFAPLRENPRNEGTGVSVLVRIAGGMVEYLSPTGEPLRPLERRLSVTTPNLDVAFAAQRPGDFAEKVNDRGNPVLTTGRAVPDTPWVVVRTIGLEAAMAASDAQMRRNAVYIMLATALTIAFVFAAWRHGATRRLTGLADKYRALADRLEQQQKELRLITDTQSDAVFIVDGEDRIRFANRAFASRLGIGADETVGKQLSALIGPAAAASLRDAIVRCRNDRIEIRQTERGSDSQNPIVLQAIFIPLPKTASELASVLVIEHDITNAIADREHRARMLTQLIDMLMASIDLRDPSAASHSARVAALSRGVAEELGLDEKLIASIEMAGRLVNFGKMLVPPEILTRAGPLTPEERETVSKSLAATADIVATVDFDGPVVQILRTAAERCDGTGPQGLKGANVPIASQIVAAANIFVAAAAPRAYRKVSGLEHALATIQAEAGRGFERRVVSALANFVDNRGGRSLLGFEGQSES